MNLIFDSPLYAYLGQDEAIDHEHPLIQAAASDLRHEGGDDVGYASAAFGYVRDTVTHSADARDRRVTWRASDVLVQRTGLCYAKSHLYVALLRAAGIPSGLCYQRLTNAPAGHVLHGLAAVELDGLWVRLDPRGEGVEFSAVADQLAFAVRPELGEIDYPTVFASPAPVVLDVLRSHDDCLALCAGGLPAQL